MHRACAFGRLAYAFTFCGNSFSGLIGYGAHCAVLLISLWFWWFKGPQTNGLRAGITAASGLT
ncbi:hypothetical protein PSE_3949 [Pseudovibrio sp. FO-BEG1]|nr:hypothetical protein PSE_3949 [Pseudovibrio sp. FO-BEG1]